MFLGVLFGPFVSTVLALVVVLELFNVYDNRPLIVNENRHGGLRVCTTFHEPVLKPGQLLAIDANYRLLLQLNVESSPTTGTVPKEIHH